MDGPKVKEFEKKSAQVFGKKFGLLVNSGSSANLLALAAFNFKKFRDHNSLTYFLDNCSSDISS